MTPKDLKNLEKVIDLLKKKGVTHFKNESIELDLATEKEIILPKSSDLSNKTKTSKEKEQDAEDILFHSAKRL